MKMISYRSVLIVTMAAGLSLNAQQGAGELGKSKAPPKVVFVCEHGAAFSIIAKAEFERMAKQHGMNFTILARGTDPNPEVSASVRQGLRSDGMEVGVEKPLKVTAADLKGAARVITFGPDLSSWLSDGVKPLDWSATPSGNYRAASDYIRKQVENLLDDLGRQAKRK
jgi:hypothetical protein